jgi:hypothetical protein
MEQRSTETTIVTTMRVDAFSGGMNTSVDATEIADNEATLIENFEYDDANNLVTRNGITLSGDDYSSRITSIFPFSTDAGFIGILYTQGTKIFSRPLTLGSITDLTGSLTLPSDTRWYWAALNNVAVGVNGATGSGNPIQVVGGAPGTASHLAAAPDGKYIVEFRNRLWIVHAANLNRIQCSDLGTATVWNTDGFTNPAHGVTIDVVPGDNDQITGLYATKERLFIFKRRKIYVLRALALPDTDPNSWEIVEFSKEIGCVSQTTIRQVFDDVVFLSDGGLVTLSAAEVMADFKSGLVSGKIAAIQDISKNVTDTDIFGFTLHDRSQYWLSVASTFSPIGKSVTFVLDFKEIQKGVIRWVQFDGMAFATAMALYNQGTDQLTYLIGVDEPDTTNFKIGTYKPNAAVKVFADGALAISQRVMTKAYDFGLADIRKLYMAWYLGILIKSAELSIGVSYFLDAAGSPEGSYSFGIAQLLGGSFWDIALWDTGIWDSGPSSFRRLIRRAFLHGRQKKAVNLSMQIICAQVNQGFSIVKFGIKYSVLSENKAANI